MNDKIRKELETLGITGVKNIYYNPSYEELFKMEMDPSLTGYDKGQLTELDAINVMTGIYTGRSPKDKYIVMDENSKNTVWWTSEEYKNDNHPMSEAVWSQMKDLAKKELCGKELFVVDAFCGANKDTRIAVRFIMEVAWQAHFVTNMFIKPSADELKDFKPGFTVYTASKAKVDNYKEGYVLHDELLSASPGYRRHALLRQYRHAGQAHRHLLRSLRHRQDHP